ncbi:hypothetical protein [Niabella hibiscisoli]|uniref:hypothetical protein n=1 Tax=Niabella hibiscisoli TaxID=1825928 RepID=UPI001F0FD7D2|nr:hypothetical protein [Niabella hibiscisoli]MCH5720887.1 hypothetical protein [Niabella hibiscisoli]
MKKEIFKVTLISGMLDIMAAFSQAYMVRKTPPDIVLRYIASGLFGKPAFSGGVIYPTLGLVFHFLIVFACAVTYFWLFTRVALLRRSVLLSAFLIALVAWVVTTQVVIRLSKITAAPVELNSALVAIVILWICVGLPIAFMAKQHFKKTE